MGNIELMSSIDPRLMNDGATVPFEYIHKRLPRGILIDMGAGGKFEKAKALSQLGYPVVCLDVLPDYGRLADQAGLWGEWMDVTTFSIPENNQLLLGFIELHHTLMQGLLVNLVGEAGEPGWQRALWVADMFTRPGGWIFGADVLRQDVAGQAALAAGVEWTGLTAHIRSWEQRYLANVEAFNYPYGTVVVGKPGPEKAAEWGAADVLIRMVNEKKVERIVHHLDPNDLITCLQDLGVADYHFTRFPSRNPKREYLGIVYAVQKGERYKYHPWYKGLSDTERSAKRELRKWYTRARPFSYWAVAFTLMAKNLPDPSFAPWIIEARDKYVREFLAISGIPGVNDAQELLEMYRDELEAAEKGNFFKLMET